MAEVTCPSCFQDFDVPEPAPSELPADVDYDCEICCRPMRVWFDLDPADDIIQATAYSLGESGPMG
jgi:hypothetical protein